MCIFCDGHNDEINCQSTAIVVVNLTFFKEKSSIFLKVLIK